MTMNILLLTIGNSTVLHQQTHYALRTLRLHMADDDRLYVLTDSPQLYTGIPFVQVVPLDVEAIRLWKGTYGYFFRAKIMAVQRFAHEHPDSHLMFVDSDTYCMKSLGAVVDFLDRGDGVMHRDEGCMAQMADESQQMWQQTRGRSYAGILIDERFHMWNSGVVAIPGGKVVSVMDKALELCDALLADGVTCFNLEQWAVAIALTVNCNVIHEAYPYIGHYWHHKYVWTRHVAGFFARSYAKGWSLDEELERLRRRDHGRLARLLAFKRIILKVVGRKNG